MFAIVTTLILYVCGFVFLYGVIRLGVRHGIEDAEARRADLWQAERSAQDQNRAFLRENAFIAGN